jgi:hypothetical protein
MVAERPSRPAGEALDYIIDAALNPGGATAPGADGAPTNPDLASQLRSVLTGMSRFMRSLSN